jgi:hypothetical protein
MNRRGFLRLIGATGATVPTTSCNRINSVVDFTGLRRRNISCFARNATSTTGTPLAQPLTPYNLWLIEITDWTQNFSRAIVGVGREVLNKKRIVRIAQLGRRIT